MRFAFMYPTIRNGEPCHVRSFEFKARDEADLLAVLDSRLPSLGQRDALVPLNDEALATLLRFSTRKP
jgi:hypothetical protein